MSNARYLHEAIRVINEEETRKRRACRAPLRLTARQKFLHGFVKYIHEVGLPELLEEERMKRERRVRRYQPKQKLSIKPQKEAL
ncbi:MAG: hypothetical protein FWH22_03225 [Fibromonadales bacterium]|nr:hypothetical protein [Fibromonadales bacterium]